MEENKENKYTNGLVIGDFKWEALRDILTDIDEEDWESCILEEIKERYDHTDVQYFDSEKEAEEYREPDWRMKSDESGNFHFEISYISWDETGEEYKRFVSVTKMIMRGIMTKYIVIRGLV